VFNPARFVLNAPFSAFNAGKIQAKWRLTLSFWRSTLDTGFKSSNLVFLLASLGCQLLWFEAKSSYP